MNLDDFSYDLPEGLIAQHPLHERDKAKLMIIDRKRKIISHDIFSNIGKYLPKESMIVLNNSKVIKARLLSKREGTGGEVEIFLLNRIYDDYHYEALLRPLRRLKKGEEIKFAGSNLKAVIVDKGRKIVRVNRKNIYSDLAKIGHIPLPPYIKRKDNKEDSKYYQTVYASKDGSVASPTAGLHFTNRLLIQLKKQKHSFSNVALHVSYGTFKPVEEQDITKHKIHSEEYSVRKQDLNKIKKAKLSHKKIVAVGTTSCRVLETIAKGNNLSGETNIFIYPGYKFNLVDCLITNFHLPRTTLLMLVYAFGGDELMKKAYNEAIKKKYRFFSYGDGMLII